MTMLKATIDAGTGQDFRCAPLAPEVVAAAIAKCQARALELFGGYTILRTEGGWRDGVRDFRETGIRFEVYASGTNATPKMRAFARYVSDRLQQVCVTLHIEAYEVDYVS